MEVLGECLLINKCLPYQTVWTLAVVMPNVCCRLGFVEPVHLTCGAIVVCCGLCFVEHVDYGL